MDVSPEYIKMCDCPEIQKRRGAWSAHDYEYLDIHIPYDTPLVDGMKVGEAIWLPRQDQLQAMVDADWTGELLRRFYNWCKDYGFTTKVRKSMEQLWLAFVMKELHNKAWGRDGWE
ncbi:hypothetical protein LCGC14_0917400 [marine sediment metagenome]|uniref:Uncharacterized protein n=1 Tax=marine sediment metagenome TaxID=412755 RepID=A0A0F9NWM6_9ZZZZ